MARSQKYSKSFKHGAHSSSQSQKSSNASGYAKRKSLKSKTLSSGSLGDVYEYQADKVRRAKVKLQLERDEMMGAGRPEDEGSEDEDGGMGRGLHPRLLGENDDDDGLNDDEDEEIDSDEAFEESDEERYAGLTFASSKVGETPILYIPNFSRISMTMPAN